MSCTICGMSGKTGRHHKFDCPNGDHHRNKVAGPLSMLHEYAPGSDDSATAWAEYVKDVETNQDS